MKKIWIGLLSVLTLFAGGISLTNNFAVAQAEGSNMTINDVVTAIKNNQDITLTNDIEVTSAVDLNDLVDEKYNCTLDGNGHTITNLSLYSSEGTGYLGLIPQANGATIKNLKLDGTLTFDLSNVSSGGYVGGLVGYGENTSIQNCEINLDSISGLDIDKNLTFGAMAGQIYGSQSKIFECVTDYDVKVNLNSMVSAQIGGVVGVLEQGAMINTINNGSITYEMADDLEALENVTQKLGGCVGLLKGTNAQVKNCLYGGKITYSAHQALSVGAIIGGCQNVDSSLVRYNYYTQLSPAINPVGDGSIAIRENLQRLTNINEIYTEINKAVLQNGEVAFDSIAGWDLEKTWDYVGGEIVLQCFQSYAFSIASNYEIVLGDKALLDNPIFTPGEYEYDQPITIEVQPKTDYNGWLDKLTVYRNGQKVEEIAINGNKWTFETTANASTAGAYSFSASQRNYECEVATENINKGGVKIKDASAITDKLLLNFNLSNKTRSIVAKAEPIFAFKNWQLNYYDDGTGEWVEYVDLSLPLITSSNLNVEYGTSVRYDPTTSTLSVNQKFKLVAVFTPDPAIAYFKGDSNILAISFDNREGAVAVSKSAKSLTLKVTVRAGFDLDVSAFQRAIIILCTQNGEDEYVIPVNFQNDSILDQDGNTIYSFNIDVSAIKNFDRVNLEDEEVAGMQTGEYSSFTVNLVTSQSELASRNNVMWLWIILPIAGVAIVGAVLALVLIKRGKGNGKGGRGGKASSTQAKPKSESYKDYFI